MERVQRVCQTLWNPSVPDGRVPVHRPSFNIVNLPPLRTTRGDQKVLQFGYKKLPYYMLSFFDYHATSMVIFNFRSLLFML